MSLSPYLLNVALHATVLSAALVLALLFARNPHRRAAFLLTGLLAVLLLPWVSALRSQPEKQAAVWVSPVIVKLPQWTVARVAAPEAAEISAPSQETVAIQTASAPEVEPTPPAVSKPLNWRQLLAWGWGLGSTLLLAALLVAYLRLIRWTRRLSPLTDAEGDLLKSRLLPAGLSGKDFRVAATETSPCVAGLIRPVMVVPRFLLQADQERELRWALGHEACHWRGGDSRWIAVLGGIRALYWWNPLVHFLIAAWSEAREQICDLAAADDDRADYGQFLIAMAVRPLSGCPLAIPMVVRSQRLRRLRARVISLLNAKVGKQAPFGRRFHVVAGSTLLVAALLISGMTIAQDKAAVDAPEKASPPLLSELMDPADPFHSHDDPIAADDKPAGTNHRSNIQIKIETNVVYSTHPIVADNLKVIPAADYQTFRRSLLKDRSNVISAFPSITCRDRENAVVEIIRELIYADENGKFVTHNRGWVMHVLPAIENEQLTLSVKAEYGFLRGQAFGTEDPTPLSPKGDPHTFTSATGESHAVVALDDVLVTPLGLVEKGCYVTVFNKAMEIDATGLPTRPTAFPPKRLIAKEKIRLRGKISTYALTKRQKRYRAEVEEMRKQSPGYLQPQSYGGQSEDPADAVPYFAADRPAIAAVFSSFVLLDTTTGAVKGWPSAAATISSWKGTGDEETLEAVEISSGKMVRPWKDLNLELETGLKESFFATELVIDLQPNPAVEPSFTPPGGVWVIELKPIAPGTRRLLFITPEWLR